MSNSLSNNQKNLMLQGTASQDRSQSGLFLENLYKNKVNQDEQDQMN